MLAAPWLAEGLPVHLASPQLSRTGSLQLRQLSQSLRWQGEQVHPGDGAALLEALEQRIALSPLRQGPWGVEALHRALLGSVAGAPLEQEEGGEGQGQGEGVLADGSDSGGDESDGGTGLSSGTSGGVLAFTASGTIASSAALTASGLVLGGGAGAVPSTVAGLATDGTSVLSLGVAGTSVGGVDLKNATSGTLSIRPPTGALGTVTV